MATKLLVFLAICLAVAVSQSSAENSGEYTNSYNNNNDNNYNYNSNSRGSGSGSNGNNRNSNYGNNGNSNSNSYNNGNYNGGNSNRNSNSNSNYNNNMDNNERNNNYNSNGNNGNNYNNNRNAYCSSIERKTRSLNVTCVNQLGDAVSCTERVVSGTKALLKCKKNYVVQEEGMIPDMTCQNGVWNRELRAFRCISVPIAVGYNYSVGLGFYKFYKSGRKWEEAKKICENDGGHLLVIDTPEERDIVSSSMSGVPMKVKVAGASKNGTKNAKGVKSTGTITTYTANEDLLAIYVGVSDWDTTGVMMSVTNVTQAQGWCDAAKSEKAIAIRRNYKYCLAMRPGSLCFVEFPCTYKRSFICEVEPSREMEGDKSSPAPRVTRPSKVTATKA